MDGGMEEGLWRKKGGKKITPTELNMKGKKEERGGGNERKKR